MQASLVESWLGPFVLVHLDLGRADGAFSSPDSGGLVKSDMAASYNIWNP